MKPIDQLVLQGAITLEAEMGRVWLVSHQGDGQGWFARTVTVYGAWLVLEDRWKLGDDGWIEAKRDNELWLSGAVMQQIEERGEIRSWEEAAEGPKTFREATTEKGVKE